MISESKGLKLTARNIKRTLVKSNKELENLSAKDDNLNLFICKIFKKNELIETGEGNSKKKSEQNASKNALIKFHVLSE